MFGEYLTMCGARLSTGTGTEWITQSLSTITLNTLRPRQNGLHFPDDIFKWIFVNENGRISINISLKFVPRVPINNIPALVQIMAWRRPGDKSLSEQMLVILLTHTCVIRLQWVNQKNMASSLTESECLGPNWIQKCHIISYQLKNFLCYYAIIKSEWVIKYNSLSWTSCSI